MKKVVSNLEHLCGAAIEQRVKYWTKRVERLMHQRRDTSEAMETLAIFSLELEMRIACSTYSPTNAK